MISAIQKNNITFLLQVSFLGLLVIALVQPSFAVGSESPSRSWGSWIKPALGVVGVGGAAFVALTKYVNDKQAYHCNQYNGLVNRQHLHNRLRSNKGQDRLFFVGTVGRKIEYFDKKGFLWYKDQDGKDAFYNTPARKELLEEYRKAAREENEKDRRLCIKRFLVEKDIDTLLKDPVTKVACQDFLQRYANNLDNDEERKRSVASLVVDFYAPTSRTIFNDANKRFKPILVQLVSGDYVEKQKNDILKHSQDFKWYQEQQRKSLGIKIGVSALVGVAVVGGVGVADRIIGAKSIWDMVYYPSAK